MKTYKINVVWQMYGSVEVEANSLEEAVKPSEMTLVIEGDVDIEDEIAEEIADAISDKTGWCVGSFNHEIV